jgi:inner membrane protein YhjD
VASRRIESLDAYQRKHRWLGFPLAVIYKFADDQGPYLTALITYYGFLSLFPLLLLTTTILGFVLQDNPGLQEDLVDSTLSQLPIIGSQLQSDVETLEGSGVGLVVGILGTVYGSLGVAGAAQNAFHRAWAVPRNERPNPFATRLRSLVLLVLLGVGILASSTLAALSTGGGAFGADFGTWLTVATIPLTALLNVGLFLIAFRLLTHNSVPILNLISGAVVAGIGWQIVQAFGTLYVGGLLKGSSQAYGVFGLVLGLIAWLYLLAVLLVLAAEITVVSYRRLWPRALLTPFTDQVDLTPADERAYTAYAESERHKGFETVEVEFDPPPDKEEEADPKEA